MAQLAAHAAGAALSLLRLFAPTVAVMTAREHADADITEFEAELDQARALSAQAAERLRAFSATRRDVNTVLNGALARQASSRTVAARLRRALTRTPDTTVDEVAAARRELADLDARMEQAAEEAQRAHAHARQLEHELTQVRSAAHDLALALAQSGPRSGELARMRDQERRAAASAALLRRLMAGVDQVIVQLDGAADAMTQRSYRPLPHAMRAMSAGLASRSSVDVSALNLGPLAGQTASGSALPDGMRDELVASLRSLRDRCRALSVSASGAAWSDARRQAGAVRYELAAALAWLDALARESGAQADAIVRASLPRPALHRPTPHSRA